MSGFFSCLVRPAGLVLSLTIAASSGLAYAQTVFDPYGAYRSDADGTEFQYDDSEDIPWIESETEVLAVPREEDLHPVIVKTLPPGMRLFADVSRITVGEQDHIIRLWLVVRSAQGAENGSFEGYRCDTGEYKVYAYANPARTPPVTKARRALWRPVQPGPRNTYRNELMREYFCPYLEVRNAHDIRDSIVSGRGSDGFLRN